jgi:hypothetical protein
MAIEFRCTGCQRLLRVADEAVGSQAQCPECGGVSIVPPASQGPPSPFATGPSQGGEPEWVSPLPSGESPFGAGGPQSSPPPGEVNPYQAPAGYGSGQGYYNPAEAAAVAAARVSGPATALLITGWLGIVLQACGFLGNVVQLGMQANIRRQPQVMPFEMSAGIGVFFGIIGIGIGVLIIVGASKMKKLESYGTAMAGAIVAMIPCMSPCCLLGLPFGIWALVVLNDPAVKSAFRS